MAALWALMAALGRCAPLQTHRSAYTALLALLLSCTPSWADSYEVSTFNADLTPRYEYEARRNTLFIEIAETSSDVICVQGIPSETDIREVVSVSSSSYPYSWSFLHNDDGVLAAPEGPPYNPCNLDDVVDFCVCADTNCREVGLEDREAYLHCLVRWCSPLEQFPPRCVECVLDTCFQPQDLGATFGCMLNITIPGGEFCDTFLPGPKIQSTKGLVLLSKLPLSDLARGNILPSRSYMPVGYLRASIEGLGGVVCATLTPFLGEPYFDHQTGMDSYEEENVFETLTLLGQSENNLIMGDFNFSPALPQATPPINGRFTHSYDVMQRLGFTSLNAALQQCTVCTGNPLVSYILARNNESFILDHVFLRDNAPFTVDSTEVLPYGLWSNVFADGPPYLSSHYGVTATLTRT